MTMGLPVVGLRWAGPAQLFDGLESMLVEPAGATDVTRSIAAAMNRLATNPDHARRVAEAARARALDAFQWEAVLDQWHGVYRRAMEQGRDRAGSVEQTQPD